MVRSAERADARANRARLIAAAHAVFRERGLDAEMKEIAERAGLGIGTIYRNFPTKDDLVTAIIGEAITRIHDAVESALTVDDAAEAVRTLLYDGLLIVEEFGDLMMAMMAGDMPPACHEQFDDLAEHERIAALIRRGMHEGIFRADVDAEIMAAQIITSFVPWEYQRLRETRGHAEIAAAYADLILRGALAPEESR